MGKVQLNNYFKVEDHFKQKTTQKSQSLSSKKSLNNTDISWEKNLRKKKDKDILFHLFIQNLSEVLPLSQSQSQDTGNSQSRSCPKTYLQALHL